MGLNMVPAQEHRFSEIPGALCLLPAQAQPDCPSLPNRINDKPGRVRGVSMRQLQQGQSSVSPPTTPLHRRHSRVWLLPITPWFLVVRAAYTRPPPGPWSWLQLHAALP